MTPEKNGGSGGSGQRQDEQSGAEWSGDSTYRESQHVSANTENQRPHDPSGGIEEKEPGPGHAIDTGEQGGSRAQQSDKSAEEYDCASVATKEILPELDPPLVESNTMAMAQ